MQHSDLAQFFTRALTYMPNLPKMSNMSPCDLVAVSFPISIQVLCLCCSRLPILSIIPLIIFILCFNQYLICCCLFPDMCSATHVYLTTSRATRDVLSPTTHQNRLILSNSTLPRDHIIVKGNVQWPVKSTTACINLWVWVCCTQFIKGHSMSMQLYRRQGTMPVGMEI